MKKRVLIACEYSGTTRREFAALGWDAWSCDLLDSEDNSNNHYKGSVFNILNDGWDLLIAHPPCTYLSYAGTRHWASPSRTIERIKAAEFFMKLYESEIEHICIENPRGIMSKIFRPPNQEIHPYFFGEKEMKRTCLWLKNLPLLTYALQDNLFAQATACNKPEPISIETNANGKTKKRYFTDSFSDNKLKTGHERSRSFSSISKAMAEQYTKYIQKIDFKQILNNV